jgi:hypothetical protein
LYYLNCNYNSLTSLNVSGLASLYYLNCSYNSLTSLDVSGLTSLEYLDCSYNSLTSLKVAATLTDGIDCRNNFLTATDAIEGFGGKWDRGGFSYTPQKDCVDITGKSVATIKSEIEAVFTSGHNPFVTGSKTNATEALVIDIGSGKTLFWGAVYSGNGSALELKGSGTFCVAKGSSSTLTKLISDAVSIDVAGSLTVTDLIVDTAYTNVTGKLTAGSFLATDECGIYAHDGGEVLIKGNAVFEGSGAYLEAQNGRITVDGNAVAPAASGWTLIQAYGRTGEVVIKGNVTTVGYAVEVWDSGKVTVHGDVVTTGTGIYAIGCWGNGTVHVKGNVMAENGYAIRIDGGLVKIDGTVTVADKDRHIRDDNKSIYIPESDLTANVGGYDSVYSGDGWTVYVGKQTGGGNGDDPGKQPDDGGGDNTLLFAAVAVAAVLALVVVYFVFIRKP